MSSLVTAVPDLIEAAAGDLANIRSTLSAASAAAAPSMTALEPAAADEVSAAITRLFGSYGKEFQALGAQASAFHAEFASLLNGGAVAYLGTDVANAEQNLRTAVNAPAMLGNGTGLGISRDGGGLGSLPRGLNNIGHEFSAEMSTVLNGFATNNSIQAFDSVLSRLFAANPTPAAAQAQNPYLALWDQTGANLSAMTNTWSSHPFPLLTQILINQDRYAALIGMQLAGFVADFPGGLPEQFQAFVQAASTWNPLTYLQGVSINLAHDGQTISTGLAKAGQDLQATIPVSKSDLAQANQQLRAGNYPQAVNDVAHSAIDLFISGFDTSHLQVNVAGFPNDLISGPIFVEGPAADLLPILAIPGHEAQNFAGIFPSGSIGGQMAQNYANLVNTFTNADITATVGLDINILNPLATPVAMTANFGPVLQLGFALLGPPITAMDGLSTAGTVFGQAMQTGDFVGAVNAIVDTPAYVMNGLINGQVIVDLNLPVTETLGPLAITVPAVVHLPFDGLLVQPQYATATVNLTVPPPPLPGVTIPYNLTVNGTQFGGLLPFLVNTLPEALATSITPPV